MRLSRGQEVNPDVKLSVVWAYTGFDPAKEADAAKALIEQGVVVICSIPTPPPPLAEAAKTPASSVSASLDMAGIQAHPAGFGDHHNRAPYYIERVKEALMDWDLQAVRRLGGASPGARSHQRDRRGAGRGQGQGRGRCGRIAAGTLHPLHRAAQQAGRHATLQEGRDPGRAVWPA